MTTDTQRIRLEKKFRDFIKSVHGENAWRKYAGSELEGTCVNFIKQSCQSEIKESIKNMERVIREQKETIDSFRLQLKDAKQLLGNSIPIWREGSTNWKDYHKRLKELI